MEISKQVVSLELSKSLKEAGYPQLGLWWWWVNKLHPKSIPSIAYHGDFEPKKDWLLFVAPTCAEGLDKLPDKLEFNVIAGKKKRYWLTILKIGSHWHISYRLDYRCIDNEDYCVEVDTNLAHAIHNMWLYLKKEGLLGG